MKAIMKVALDGFTLDIMEKIDARLDQLVAQHRRICELYGGKKTPKAPPMELQVELAVAQLTRRAPRKTGPKTKVVRDLGIDVIFRACLDELPRIKGSVNRALQMTKILLGRHGVDVKASAIRAACKNAEKARQRLGAQPCLPLK